MIQLVYNLTIDDTTYFFIVLSLELNQVFNLDFFIVLLCF